MIVQPHRVACRTSGRDAISSKDEYRGEAETMNEHGSFARRLARGLMSGLLAWMSMSAVVADPVPVADFFRPPAVSGAVVSPSGRYAAASMSANGGRQRLVVIDLLDVTKSKVAAAYSDRDVQAIHWVNDDRLIFGLGDNSLDLSDQWGWGLFSVDRAGSEAPRRLIKPWGDMFSMERPAPGDRSLSAAHALLSTLRDGSNDIVVYEQTWNNAREPQGQRLWRVDTSNGLARLITPGASAHADGWALDVTGAPRVMVADQAGKTTVAWKADPDAPWKEAFQATTYGGRRLDPVLVGPHDMLYARAVVSGDTWSLVRLNLREPKELQPLLSLAGYDFHGELVLGRDGSLLGVRYLTDAEATAWFDPALKKLQEKIDALLPATINKLDCGLCDHPEHLLVTSWSDKQPAVYQLYDIKAGTMTLLAASRPWIQPAAMAQRDMKRFAARDGMSIPVHVTRPNGPKQPAPMVVLVHGGPYMRGGKWTWDDESQFLASRGYVVVEPEYRGSTGFGARLYRAGWKQWGLKMQDDIADATEWAVKEGYADPKRVCIAGASYGGYAALMGLVRYPDLYRCAFEWAGVTDIDLLYTLPTSDLPRMWIDYGMPKLIGDRQADAAQLTETSPLKQAARITKPLLMAYGGIDRRVPIEHGIRLRQAIEKNNRQVEWIDYPGEGHGWMLPANNVDFWSRVEKFLGRNLATAP
jgi:dipeptidyl aminopeptidase/acylaminoacyl peptidase